MAEANGKKSPPPYVSYPSFRSFIKGLAETHVPDRIDKTVMSKYSGSTQYALLPALQWLGLIDEYGSPQSLLHEIATTDDEKFKQTLHTIIKDKYKFLFNGGLDLAKASNGQVIEAFKSQDITGSTVTKCMSFFLVAAKEAGITVSAHVKAPQAKRSPSNGKKKKPDGQVGDSGSGSGEVKTEKPPSAGTYHPFIQGLLAKLPAPDTEWAIEARAKWLTTAANIFDLMYSVPEGSPVAAINVEVNSL